MKLQFNPSTGKLSYNTSTSTVQSALFACAFCSEETNTNPMKVTMSGFEDNCTCGNAYILPNSLNPNYPFTSHTRIPEGVADALNAIGEVSLPYIGGTQNQCFYETTITGSFGKVVASEWDPDEPFDICNTNDLEFPISKVVYKAGVNTSSNPPFASSWALNVSCAFSCSSDDLRTIFSSNNSALGQIDCETFSKTLINSRSCSTGDAYIFEGCIGNLDVVGGANITGQMGY